MQAALKTFTAAEVDSVMNTPNTVSKIQEQYQLVKGEFQMTLCPKCQTKRTQPSWDVDFATMVQRLGDPYRQFYLGAYVVPTLQAHATLASSFDGCKHEDNEHKLREQDIALFGAIRMFTSMLRLQERVFSLGFAGEIDACEASMEPWLIQMLQCP